MSQMTREPHWWQSARPVLIWFMNMVLVPVLVAVLGAMLIAWLEGH